jgi:prolyl oligopeptidase
MAAIYILLRYIRSRNYLMETSMGTKVTLITMVFIFILSCPAGYTQEKPAAAKVQPVVDEYFGNRIIDPYRYLEDLKDPEVQNWFKSNAAYSRAVLNNIAGRQSLIDKMREFDQRKSARISSIRITDNNHYFYLKTTPEDETDKLFYRVGYEGKEVFLYDPSEFDSNTGQKYTITSLSPSDDGSKVAFEVAPNGSESTVLLIMDVKQRTLYPEKIDRCWYAFASWLPSGEAFLFSRLQSSDVHHKDRQTDSKVYLHKTGTDPENDREIFSRAKYPELDINPEDFPILQYDKSSNYLYAIVYNTSRSYNIFYAPVKDLENNKIQWKQLMKHEDEIYDFWPTEKDLYVYTPKGAPNFKILKTSLENPDYTNAEVIVPENSQATLTSFSLTNEGLYFTLSRNGVEEKVYRMPFGTKNIEELTLPFAAGSVSLMTRGFKFSDVWVELTGWTKDNQRFRYNASGKKFIPENLSTPAEYPEFEELIVEELMIPSHDGLKVPLSLIYKKGVIKDGKNLVLIYGYGAYGISPNPYFSPNRLLWASEGGIYAVAHVRGGGELGAQWHKAGFKTTKPNTWKDLISCAEYLIKEQYTSPKKIAINGRSAGGILIGRAMTERPDLFAAAIPMVGCMNPLRFEESPNGPLNVPEFGTVKDSVECLALIEMDSYLHLKEGVKYPAALITAGMNDPRVIAWEPAKFAARLQAVSTSGKPVLFLADYESGHGIGNTKAKQYEDLADVLSFAFWQTGHSGFQDYRIKSK